jgi:hypothetical protein
MAETGQQLVVMFVGSRLVAVRAAVNVRVGQPRMHSGPPHELRVAAPWTGRTGSRSISIRAPDGSRMRPGRTAAQTDPGRLRVRSYPKTSGGRVLHVLVAPRAGPQPGRHRQGGRTSAANLTAEQRPDRGRNAAGPVGKRHGTAQAPPRTRIELPMDNVTDTGSNTSNRPLKVKSPGRVATSLRNWTDPECRTRLVAESKRRRQGPWVQGQSCRHTEGGEVDASVQGQGLRRGEAAVGRSRIQGPHSPNWADPEWCTKISEASRRRLCTGLEES